MLHGVMSMGYLPAVFTMRLPVFVKRPARYLSQLEKPALWTLHPTNRIPPPNYGHLEAPRPKQDVVPIDIVMDHIPEQHAASQMQKTHLDNSHTIEIEAKGLLIRMSNDVQPVLLKLLLDALKEPLC